MGGASAAEGGRGDRARARRLKRNVALGLGGDYAVQRLREKRCAIYTYICDAGFGGVGFFELTAMQFSVE